MIQKNEFNDETVNEEVTLKEGGSSQNIEKKMGKRGYLLFLSSFELLCHCLEFGLNSEEYSTFEIHDTNVNCHHPPPSVQKNKTQKICKIILHTQ